MTSSIRSLNRSSRGFSMVEMIGVLAIIAILAVIIVPKVFSTIASSRVTNAVASINAAKTAVTEFAGKFGTIPTTDSEARIDDLLVAAGLLEQRFTVKIGNQPSTRVAGDAWTRDANGVWQRGSGGASQAAQSKLICVTSNASTPASGNNYFLDGTTNLPTGSRVVSAHIVGLTPAEARELSLRIDGEMFSETATGTADTRGKVVYPVAGNTVYIYLAHQ